MKARPIGVFCQLNPLRFDGLGEPANCGPTVLNFHLMDELAIQAETSRRDPSAGSVITANSISTFFTPLAEQALNRGSGHRETKGRGLPEADGVRVPRPDAGRER